jgi:hypothetical protein
MRRAIVYITLVLLLATAVTAGWIAADWPQWCRQLQWCAPQFGQPIR